MNNVETFAASALVAVHGAEWLRSRGTAKSTGTKVLSVSGDVARPGIYEYPFGVTVQQVLDDCGAVDTQAVQVGGPSGTLLARSEFRRRIAFEDVPSAGAFMVFDSSRDMLAVIDNFARFFAHESCGFCTPCRVGTTLVKQMTGHLVAGKGTRRDVKDLVAGVHRHEEHESLRSRHDGGKPGAPRAREVPPLVRSATRVARGPPVVRSRRGARPGARSDRARGLWRPPPGGRAHERRTSAHVLDGRTRHPVRAGADHHASGDGRRRLRPVPLLQRGVQAARELQGVHGEAQRPYGCELHDAGARRATRSSRRRRRSASSERT